LIPINFEALFARSSNAYVVLDNSLSIIWMNDAYLRVTMRDRDQLLGRKIFEAFPSDPRSDGRRLFQESLERVLATRETDEIALTRYDIENADGGMGVRYWSTTHTPLLDDAGAVTHILQHAVDVTELHGLRRLRDQVGVVERASAVQARNLGLAEETSQLKSMFEQAPGFVAVLTGPEHRFQMANGAYRHLVGRRELLGKRVEDALPEVAEQGFVAVLDKVWETGTAYVARSEAVQLNRLEGEPRQVRHLDFIFQPIYAREGGGDVTGIFIQGYDVSEEVASRERQRLMINELNHRVKNTLAIVQSLASQSFRLIPDSDPARRTFDSRLNALAAAHSLLTERNWQSAGLVDTVRASVVATAGDATDRFHITGPDFTLCPQTAVSLAMIVHELSTNAIKHGALSNDVGEVEIGWRIEEAGDQCRLTIDWVEHGGPPVVEPSRRGFGTRLIERGLSAEHDAEISLQFEPRGLHCTLSATLEPGLA